MTSRSETVWPGADRDDANEAGAAQLSAGAAQLSSGAAQLSADAASVDGDHGFSLGAAVVADDGSAVSSRLDRAV